MLPSRLRHRINALQSVTVPMANTGPTVDPSTLTAIAAACRDSLRLRFDYRTHDGTSSICTTEPYRLVHAGRRWYVIGWDVDRQDWAHLPRGPPRATHADRPPVHPAHPARPDISGYTSRAISTSAYRYQAPFHPARQRRDRGGADRAHHRSAGADR